jgi:hypothetical protein
LKQGEGVSPRLAVYRQPKEKREMCNIGKPLEFLEVEPLVLPAPLRKETEQPTEQPVSVEAPVSETTVEPLAVTVEKL